MAAPPPPPPPPMLSVTASTRTPSGPSLSALLANSSLSTGDVGSTGTASGGNPANAAPDVVRAPEPSQPKKAPNPFMDELAGRLGTPKESDASSCCPMFPDKCILTSLAPDDHNPSMSRPGYRPPAGLPEKGTQGHEMVHYSISGPQVFKVQAAADFLVHCRNDDKELIDIPITILEAEITQNKDKGETMMGKISKTDEKGVLKVTFRGRYVGEHFIQLYVKGALERRPVYPPPGIPLQIIASDPVVKENLNFSCRGFGMYGGTVGRMLNFDIVVRNDKGEYLDINREKLRVTLSQGLKKNEGHVERISEGKYKAEITPFGPGEMVIKVAYGGQDVIETTVSFNKGIDAQKTEIVNAPSSVPLNAQQAFQIQARDSDGAAIANGGEKFEVAVSGPSQGVTGLVVRDELTGLYTVRFTLTKAGDYSIFVSLKGAALRGSPIKVHAE